MSDLLKNLEPEIRQRLSVTDAGHDWWHAVRVKNNAFKIAEKEGGNKRIIEAAALVHDLVDDKFFDPQQAESELKVMLEQQGFSEKETEHVLNIITQMSFSKELEGTSFDSLEFRIVRDADRLDAIGAIGIARTFSYGGHKGREFYNPGIPPAAVTTKDEYRNSTSPTINHFYEKLLKLKDLMKTPAGKQMAEERHAFMEQFLKHFFTEWEGK